MRGVIDAFAALQTRFPDATLGIAGEGPERAQLEAYAKSRASGGITFLGTQEHGQLLRIIRNADVFVLNSEYEGLSHVLIEALLLGMPIVASKAGGNGEVIKDEENGLLVPVGDMDALTAAIARILSDKAFAGRLGEGARASRGRFTVEAMLSKTKALLV
jgi:glycosyltransferase involved in cell wall biosynthesis